MQPTGIEVRGVVRTLPAVEWSLLLAALALLTTAHTFSCWTGVAMAALAAFFALRARRGVIWPNRTGLEAPLGLFLLSAGVAVWVAYDPLLALLQFSRMLAGVALFSLLPGSSANEQRWLAVGLVLAAVVLAVCWPLQHDFTAEPVKFAPAQSAGLWVNAHLPRLVLTALTGVPIHRNVAAGTLALALPFALGLACDARRGHRRVGTALALLGALAILVGLLLTTSCGAWLGLVVSVALGLAIMAARRRWFAELPRKGFILGAAVVATLIILGELFASRDAGRVLTQLTESSETWQSRLALWWQGLGLVRDYAYTGSGLRSFWMVHATYALLIHTPFIAHAHNTFLEVWIEQGILGAVALAWGGWVAIGCARRAVERSQVPALGWAGLASLAAVVVHGTVDVVFYVERTLPLLGLTLGYAWLGAGPQPVQPHRTAQTCARHRLGVLMFLGACTFFHRSLLGAWHANLGTVEQTRQELGRYDPTAFYTIPLDHVRRDAPLGDAEARFRRAMAWQPGNRTALQRLAQISLSRGDYSQALRLTQTAWDLGYRDDVSRLLHGDALVANGQVDAAVQAVQGLTWAARRLAFQGAFRYFPQSDYRRAISAWQAALLLDPTRMEFEDLLRQAREQLASSHGL